MEAFIISVMEKFGYLGIFLLITLENVFPPIPSEVILTFGGFMTTKSSLSVAGVIIFATLGSVVGAIVLYLVGRILNKNRLYKLVDGKVGKILRFKREDIDKSEAWFENKGKITVLFCRCIPIVRSLISIPAGMTKMNMPLFLIYTTIGSLVWNTILVILGSIVGENWNSIVTIFDKFSNIVLIILVIIFIVGIYIFYKKRLNKKEEK